MLKNNKFQGILSKQKELQNLVTEFVCDSSSSASKSLYFLSINNDGTYIKLQTARRVLHSILNGTLSGAVWNSQIVAFAAVYESNCGPSSGPLHSERIVH